MAQRADAVGWVRGVLAAVLLFVLSQLAYGVAEVARRLAPAAVPPLGRGALACAVAALLALAAMVLGLRFLFRRRLRDPARFGLAPPRRTVSSVLLFVGLSVVIAPIAAAITYALGLHGTTAIDLGRKGVSARVFLTFAAVVLAPWFEEVAARGMLLGALARRFGFWPAAVVSGVLWAAAHGRGGVLVIFSAEGVLLALMRRRTGSLLPGVGVHGSWNAIAAGASGAGPIAVAAACVLYATLAASLARLRRPAQAQ